MNLKVQSAQPMLISHRPPLWGGFADIAEQANQKATGNTCRLFLCTDLKQEKLLRSIAHTLNPLRDIRNLLAETPLDKGEHILVAEANHCHEGALHDSKAGDEEEWAKEVIVPMGEVV